MIDCTKVATYAEAEKFIDEMCTECNKLSIRSKAAEMMNKEINSAKKYLIRKGIYWEEVEDIYA